MWPVGATVAKNVELGSPKRERGTDGTPLLPTGNLVLAGLGLILSYRG